MAQNPLTGPVSLTIDAPQYQRLYNHLFLGDDDEHGAIIVAGIVRTLRGTRMLTREVYLARDGIEFVPGTRGYRALTPEFIARIADRLRRIPTSRQGRNRDRGGTWAKAFRRKPAVMREVEHMGNEAAGSSITVARVPLVRAGKRRCQHNKERAWTGLVSGLPIQMGWLEHKRPGLEFSGTTLARLCVVQLGSCGSVGC